MIKVALLECKSGAMQCKRACFEPSFVVCYACERRNVLCVRKIKQIAQNSKISHQRFCCALKWEYWALEMQILCRTLGRALTKTVIHKPFVVTPFGFIISFGEWALREPCSRHPSSKQYHEWCRSITVPTKEKHKKHKAALQQDIQQVTSYG